MSLELITPVNDVFRRDVELADPTLLDPNEADALVQGEWLQYNSSSKGVRITAETAKNVMQVFTQKGDTAGQAIGKTAVIQLHEYEAETDMFDGAGSYAVDTELTVGDVTIDGVVRSALKVAAAGNSVHALCTKPPQLNGGKLRFQKRAPYIKA